MNHPEFIDQNEYERRAVAVRELIEQHPRETQGLTGPEHDRLQRYFLGSLDAPDPTRYRNDQRKLDPTLEHLGNRAYERLLVEIGIPSTLR